MKVFRKEILTNKRNPHGGSNPYRDNPKHAKDKGLTEIKDSDFATHLAILLQKTSEAKDHINLVIYRAGLFCAIIS
jgi:hypothetical protein